MAQKCIQRYSRFVMHAYMDREHRNKQKSLLAWCMIIITRVYFSIVVGQFGLKI